MRFPLPLAALAALVGLAACGGGAPSGPGVLPSVTPTPTPTPVAQATPTPEPSPTGEPPVTRTTPPVRITFRFYALEDPAGQVAIPEYDDGVPVVPVNYNFRLDAVAKDEKNKETQGDGNVTWHFSDEGLIEIVRDTNPFQYRLRAVHGGTLTTYVSMIGGKNQRTVESNPITVEIR